MTRAAAGASTTLPQSYRTGSECRCSRRFEQLAERRGVTFAFLFAFDAEPGRPEPRRTAASMRPKRHSPNTSELNRSARLKACRVILPFTRRK